jgi:thiol-disulfide isomerase/thioredoxin
MPEIRGLANFVSDFTNLRHESGKVYLLDFWATWCPPCQAPMAYNCEMIKRHRAIGDW